MISNGEIIMNEKEDFSRPHRRVSIHGKVDSGRKLGPTGYKCPICDSEDHYVTVSVEHCNNCGLHIDYWKGLVENHAQTEDQNQLKSA